MTEVIGTARRLALVALLASVPGDASTQATRSQRAPGWEISFGAATGRLHEQIIHHRVTSSGRIAYLNTRGGTPAVGRISAETVGEISRLLDRLALARAKEIPRDQWNACIVSLHLPDVWFSLRAAGESFTLRHCNRPRPEHSPPYEYTLQLTTDQRAVYRTLRAKLESLFDDELKRAVGTRQQSAGDALSGDRCWSAERRARAMGDGRDAGELPPQCRSLHACALLPPPLIRSATGRKDLAVLAPEAWQSTTSSDCFYDLALSVRLSPRGWTVARLDAEREKAARQGYEVESFALDGHDGYIVSDSPMAGMTGPYAGTTAFLRVGEQLVTISLQTFPENYARPLERASAPESAASALVTLARAAIGRLTR